MTHTAYTIVVLGDSHVEPNQCLNRFSALGRYLLHKKPTHIISIGDFLSLDSLSAWDQDKNGLWRVSDIGMTLVLAIKP